MHRTQGIYGRVKTCDELLVGGENTGIKDGFSHFPVLPFLTTWSVTRGAARDAPNASDVFLQQLLCLRKKVKEFPLEGPGLEQVFWQLRRAGESLR